MQNFCAQFNEQRFNILPADNGGYRTREDQLDGFLMLALDDYIVSNISIIGNPSMDKLAAIFGAMRAQLKVDRQVRVVKAA